MVTRAKLGFRQPTLFPVDPLSPVLKTFHSALADSNLWAAMEEEHAALLKNHTWDLVPRPSCANLSLASGSLSTSSNPMGFWNGTRPIGWVHSAPRRGLWWYIQSCGASNLPHYFVSGALSMMAYSSARHQERVPPWHALGDSLLCIASWVWGSCSPWLCLPPQQITLRAEVGSRRMVQSLCRLSTPSGIRRGQVRHLSICLPPRHWHHMLRAIRWWHHPHSFLISSSPAHYSGLAAGVQHDRSWWATPVPGDARTMLWIWSSSFPAAVYAGHLGSCWHGWLQAVFYSGGHQPQVGGWWSTCAGRLRFSESRRCPSVPHLHLTFTRPNIAYSIQQVLLSHAWSSRTTPCRTEMHPSLHQGTLHLELLLCPSSQSELTIYSYANWASCPDTHKSTSGYAVFLGDNLVS